MNGAVLEGIWALLLTLALCLVQGKLTGKFVHVTDLHLDVYYREGSWIRDFCHPDHGVLAASEETSGHFGTPVTRCDSPSALITELFRHIRSKWGDEIDFIIWTGDTVR